MKRTLNEKLADEISNDMTRVYHRIEDAIAEVHWTWRPYWEGALRDLGVARGRVREMMNEMDTTPSD